MSVALNYLPPAFSSCHLPRKAGILKMRSKLMPQIETMSLGDKLTLVVKSVELEKQGKFEEADRTIKQMPLQPYLAKFYKDHLGLDALLKTGWNLSEAEAEFGSEWLVK
jgi:hypothetical protein